MRHVQKLHRAAKVADDRLIWGLLTLSALALIAMTLIIAYNVVARALFSAPVDGVVTLVGEALMVAVVYLAFAAPVQISLRILVNRLPKRVSKSVDTISWLISMVVLFLVAWGSWDRAVVSYERAERMVGIFNFLVYPYRFLVAIGILAAGIHVFVVGRRWVAGIGSDELESGNVQHVATPDGGSPYPGILNK